MNLPPEQQKRLLVVLLILLSVLILVRMFTGEEPRTAPLTYTRGAVAASSVRPGIASPAAASNPLQAFLVPREDKFPGVIRDIFRMENPAPPKPKVIVKTAPTPTIIAPPPVPEKTQEEIAAEASRADLSKFRFLGYLTDPGKESSLFLAKDGETFIVRSGDTILKNYRVKEAGKDHVVLLDSVTRVEVKVELSGGGEQTPGAPQKPQRPW